MSLGERLVAAGARLRMATSRLRRAARARLGTATSRLRRAAGRLPSPLGRPLVGPPVPGAWVIVLVGLAFGYEFYEPHVVGALSAWPPAFEPTSSHNLNFEVYHVAAEVALAGGEFYDAPPEGRSDQYVYLYPPITVVAFVPFTLVDAWTAYGLATGLSVLAAAASTWAVVAYVEGERAGERSTAIDGHGTADSAAVSDSTTTADPAGIDRPAPTDVRPRRLGWLDAALIFAFFVGSIYAAGTVVFGNVNLWLAAFVSVGLLALSRGREVAAGILLALAALFKLFPALVGLWLLRARAWRATAVAIATGVSGIVAGLLAFGRGPTEYYVREVVVGRSETAAFVGGYPPGALNYVTAQRPLSWLVWRLHPGASAAWLYVATALALGAVLLFFYADLSRPMDRHAAVFVSVAAAVVAFPALRWYLVLVYLPLLVLAYDWEGPGYGLFVAGGVIFSISVHPRDVYAFLASPTSAGWLEPANAAVPLVDVVALVGTFEPLLVAATPLAALASPQLWGLVLVCVACGRAKVAAGTDPANAVRRWRVGERPAPWIDAAATPPFAAASSGRTASPGREGTESSGREGADSPGRSEAERTDEV